MKARKLFSLYRRGGIWYVRLWDKAAGTYTGGKSTGEADHDKAIVKADRMIKAGQIKKKENDPFITDHLKEYWKNRKNEISASYYVTTLRAIDNRIVPFKDFQKLRLSQLKPAHIHRLVDHLKATGVTVRPINLIIQTIKLYLRWAYKRDYILSDIAGKIENQKEPKSTRGFLTPEEIMRLATLPWPDIRIKAAVALGLFAGLRRGEILALRWQDIDFEKNTIEVRRNFVGEYDDKGNPIFKTPKTDSGRKFPYLVFPELKNTLLALLKETPYPNPGDLILINIWRSEKYNEVREYRPMDKVTIRRNFPRMLEKIGISAAEQRQRKLVFHGLRHSFASLMSTVATVSAVMPLTGHRQISTFQGYAHSIDAAAVAALEAANRALEQYRGKVDDDNTVH